jgi:hypothetical protein
MNTENFRLFLSDFPFIQAWFIGCRAVEVLLCELYVIGAYFSFMMKFLSGLRQTSSSSLAKDEARSHTIMPFSSKVRLLRTLEGFAR